MYAMSEIKIYLLMVEKTEGNSIYLLTVFVFNGRITSVEDKETFAGFFFFLCVCMCWESNRHCST